MLISKFQAAVTEFSSFCNKEEVERLYLSLGMNELLTRELLQSLQSIVLLLCKTKLAYNTQFRNEQNFHYIKIESIKHYSHFIKLQPSLQCCKEVIWFAYCIRTYNIKVVLSYLFARFFGFFQSATVNVLSIFKV